LIGAPNPLRLYTASLGWMARPNGHRGKAAGRVVDKPVESVDNRAVAETTEIRSPGITDGGFAGTIGMSLGLSNDPGVFPLRDTVECPRPSARVVPAVSWRVAAAVHRAAPVGVERTRA
jgi:hypothetical protein